MFARLCLSALCLTLCASTPLAGQTKKPHALKAATGTLYTGAVVEAMDGQPPYEAIAISSDGIIQNVGTTAALQAAYKNYKQVPMNGMTMMPGFIDSHSHASTFGVFLSPKFLDLGSVNVLLKPLPTNGCTDPQQCFIPVQNQDDVVNRLTAAVKAAGKTDWIVGFNYEPGRQGASSGCSSVGFACPNYLTGNTLQMLDQISTTNPIAIMAESGHYMYVNTAAYQFLNICPPTGSKVTPRKGCFTPVTANPANTNPELILASNGLMQEEMAQYAEATIIPKQLGTLNLMPALTSALNRYSNLGFTTIQEGAANYAAGAAYGLRAATGIPVTVALLVHEDTPAAALTSIKKLKTTLALVKNDVMVRGMKIFADGSNQGFSGLQSTPYLNTYPPFNNTTIYPSPYLGFLETAQSQIQQAASAAHAAGVPLWVHANGDAGVANAVNGIVAAGSLNGSPDVIIHSTFISPSLIQTANTNNIGLTMLAANLYYYGAPMCNQIIGPAKAAMLYPEADGDSPNLTKQPALFSLHSDTNITPPSPFFAMWTAVTRNVQQTSWYGLPGGCPAQLNTAEALTVKQAVQAYTSSAAALYGFTDRGVLAPNMRGDVVVLSMDPLGANFQPSQFQNIQVIETIRGGTVYTNPNPAAIVWPD